jgi:hypothetical protein
MGEIMIEMPRRKFLTVLTGIIAAPAVIKADQLMQVKTIVQPESLFSLVEYQYDYNKQTVTRKIIVPINNMDVFQRIVMEGLKNIPMEIDKRSLDIMFTPKRKGLFS